MNNILISNFLVTDWGEYGGYGGCSRTCGGGTKTRTRPCLPPGSVCVGSSTEVVECNKGPCAGKCRIFTKAALCQCPISECLCKYVLMSPYVVVYIIRLIH